MYYELYKAAYAVASELPFIYTRCVYNVLLSGILRSMFTRLRACNK